MSTVDINYLPDEVIGLIFKLLGKDDRESLSLANKRFFEIYKRKAGFKFRFNFKQTTELKPTRSRILSDLEVNEVWKIFRYRSSYSFDALIMPMSPSQMSIEDVIKGKLDLNPKRDLGSGALTRLEYLVLEYQGVVSDLSKLLELVRLFPRLQGVGFRFGISEDYFPFPFVRKNLTNLPIDLLDGVTVRELIIINHFDIYLPHLLDLFPGLDILRIVAFTDPTRYYEGAERMLNDRFVCYLEELEKRKMKVKLSMEVRFIDYNINDVIDLFEKKSVDEKIRGYYRENV